MASLRYNPLTRIGLGIFFLGVLVYAFFEARGLLWGPTITIVSDTSAGTSSFIILQGTVTHSTTLSLNGSPLSVTEGGIFSEGYVLTPGMNQLFFEAIDRYGHAAHTNISIVYTPTGVEVPIATTTTHSLLVIPTRATSSVATTTATSSHASVKSPLSPNASEGRLITHLAR